MTGERVVHHGDCRDVLADIDDCSIDAVVTDPPYGLEFMGKEWDSFSTAGANYQAWCEQWATETFRVLKPGAHLLAFGGTRTYHRLVCALEDAGFDIRDSIHWVYGTGFPKSLDVSKAMSAAADAQQWEGFGTALKPAYEPIVVARKPLAGTVAANVLAHGVGALNIDACRVGEPADKRAAGTRTYQRFDPSSPSKGLQPALHDGLARWPTNLVFSHDPDCGERCAEGCPVAELDGQSGSRPGGHDQVHDTKSPTWVSSGLGCELGFSAGRNDSGGASRFFPCFRYEAKASTAERTAGLSNGNPHPTVKPVELIRWLIRLVCPPGGVVLDPFAGSGSTLVAAALEDVSATGVEKDADYVAVAEKRVAWAEAKPVQSSLFDETGA